MKGFRLFLIVGVIVLFSLSSCKTDGPDPDYNARYLVDFEIVNPAVDFSLETAKTLMAVQGFGDFADELEYEIEIYKITYNTEFQNDTVLASGLVAVPIPKSKKEEFPILSYQHGTIVKKSSAPSENVNNELMLYMASTGMIVLIPDYIGFGASSAFFHPYMIEEYATNAVLDMIRASKELLIKEDPCNANDKLYMFGYSQGATATLGALSAIENNDANSDIKPTLVSCGSGAYDLAAMREWIMDQPGYDQPYFVAYMLESFSRYAGLDIEYSKVFSSDFADMIPGLFDGNTDESIINASFGTTHVGELFNDDFEENVIFSNADDYRTMRMAFETNKIAPWSLSGNTTVKLFYGQEDDWIPGEQSIKLWQEFQTEAGGSNITLTRISKNDVMDNKDANHINSFMPILFKSIDWFLLDSEE